MDTQQEYSLPQSLISIPEKKLTNALKKIKNNCPKCSDKSINAGLCEKCYLRIEAVTRYSNANIPVDYWTLEMDNFKGDNSLKKIYNSVILDIEESYDSGIRFCFAGNHGLGKSMTACCILKNAVEKGYSGLYVTLTEIVNLMTSYNQNDKQEARQALLLVDFLVIDEFDPRFMGSDNASDLYGRILEPTLRHRLQNKLPLILCTNSPNVTSSFNGSLKNSISSLMNMVRIIPVLGNDFRAGGKI